MLECPMQTRLFFKNTDPIPNFRGMIDPERMATFPKTLRDMLPDHQFPGRYDGAGRVAIWRTVYNFVKGVSLYLF